MVIFGVFVQKMNDVKVGKTCDKKLVPPRPKVIEICLATEQDSVCNSPIITSSFQLWQPSRL